LFSELSPFKPSRKHLLTILKRRIDENMRFCEYLHVLSVYGRKSILIPLSGDVRLA